MQRKISKVESAKAEENSQHAWVMRIFKVLCEFRITWSSWLPKAISSSFQLQIIHGLNRWIFDFLSFEMVYRMQKMDFGKCSKSAKEDCSCCPLCFSSLCFLFLCASLCLCSCFHLKFKPVNVQNPCFNLSKQLLHHLACLNRFIS